MANKVLDLNALTDEERATIQAHIDLTGGEIEAILEQTKQILTSLTKGHEDTLRALRSKARFQAFVENITAEELRREDITEESISSFLKASLDEKIELINGLDIFTVYRLFEGKKQPKKPRSKRTIEKGFTLAKPLLDELIKATKPPLEEVTAPAWLSGTTQELKAPSPNDEDTEIRVIIDYGVREDGEERDATPEEAETFKKWSE